MSGELIAGIACIAAGVVLLAYMVASAAGLICLLRGHRWVYGTSLCETVHGRECMRCGASQRWWSKWSLSRASGISDDRPDDMKRAGLWRSETQ